MELNNIIFPAPEPHYTADDFPDQLFWVPRVNDESGVGGSIPCILLKCIRGSSKVLIYFHGNAEDLSITYELLDHLRSFLLVHVIAMEYPGYGVYAGKPDSNQIQRDAENLFNFLTEYLGINQQDIILFGRSIGTGPATWIASHHNPCALVLLSAYTSLRAIVKYQAGPVLQYLVKERFRNIDLMPQVQCPTFLIHGQTDDLIPYSQSQELHANCGGPCSIHLPLGMDHNNLDFYDDLSFPLDGFLKKCEIDVMPRQGESGELNIPQGYFAPPPGNVPNKNKGRINKFLRRFGQRVSDYYN